MATGFPSSGNFGASGQNSGFGNLISGGSGQPEIDYDQVNALLQHFGGIGLANSGYQQQGLFENMSGISKRAPALAAGLDNALISLSAMGPTGATAGDNISNVARGLSAIGPTRRAQAMAPVQNAFAMAGEVAKLQQASANVGRETAMANYYTGLNQNRLDVANTRADASMYGADQRAAATDAHTEAISRIAANRNAMLAGKEPQLLADGTVGLPTVNDDGTITYQSHPEIDAKEFAKERQRKQTQGALGGGVEGAIIGGMLGDDPASFKGGPKAYWNAANNILLQHRTAAAGVSQGGADNRQGVNEWNTSQKSLFNNIFTGGTSAGARENRIKQRRQELMAGGADYTAAGKQASSEAEAHRGKLNSLWGQYNLMDPGAQQKAGGIVGYLGQNGYDPNTDSFSAPRTGAQPAAGGSPMPGGAKPGVSPAVQAILDQLKK